MTLRTLLLFFLASSALSFLSAQTGKLNYPPPPKSGQVDDYNGTKVPDPFRPLENADAPTTEKWVDEENKLTFGWLAKLPGREGIKNQLTSLWNYERFTDFFK